jgi:mono/diheme cytochrome c family protein
MARWLCARPGRPGTGKVSGGWSRASVPVVLLVATLACPRAVAADADGAANFQNTIEPVLTTYCLSCHNSTSKKGGVAFDADTAPLLEDRELWLKTLKMLQAGMMPPKGKDRPSAAEVALVEKWIKVSAFGIDPQNPDPGRVTLRRLNRTEYHNTIRDLMGVDFNTSSEFPADDTGHGFDNISDVLTLSPLVMEKYIAAARSIVSQAVPNQPRMPAEKRIAGREFASAEGKPPGAPESPLPLSYYKASTVKYQFQADHAGHYQLALEVTANETYVDNQFDYNKCRLVFKSGDMVLLSQEFVRQGGKPYRFEFEQDWPAGAQDLSLTIEPLTPKERQVRSLTLRVVAVTVRGPINKEHWVRPANYERFFPGTVPDDPNERRAYARKLLGAFATRAFRRPVDDATVDRLVRLAEATASKPGQTFEGGIAQAMTVILASPRFLFREEGVVPHSTDRYPLLDEYALATRLSYFLWSSMPDEELFRLASANKLRQNLDAQVSRLLADPRGSEFTRHFAGQWLQARNIDTANVNAFAVLSKEQPMDPKNDEKRARFRELVRKPQDTLTDAEKKELEELRRTVFSGGRRFAQFELTCDLRRAMRQETELTFDHIMRNDRSLLELLESDYTFLNERLARFYDIPGVTGDQMRKVTLPENSPRGGILTQGTFLIITSNPDRTSPVKRGLFILDNILGMPPPPPPPDVTPLEKAAAQVKDKPPTLRESLKVHRNTAICASCHNRMDPLGLAFENFNALGRWRDMELNQPVEAGGELLTGEKFKDVRALKHILVTERRLDFYRCVTEKMMIYALGRGLHYQDRYTVDEIVGRLEAGKGRPSVLIRGIIDSPAFQRRRPPDSTSN